MSVERIASPNAPIAAVSSSPAAASQDCELQSLRDASDPAKIAGSRTRVWKSANSTRTRTTRISCSSLQAFGTENVSLSTPRFFGQDEVTVLAALGVLKSWRASLAEPPTLCPTGLAEQCMPYALETIQHEIMKCKTYEKLAELFKEHTQDFSGLVFCQNPNSLFATKNYKKGELKLFPLGPLSLTTSSTCSFPHLLVSTKGAEVPLAGSKVPDELPTGNDHHRLELVPFLLGEVHPTGRAGQHGACTS